MNIIQSFLAKIMSTKSVKNDDKQTMPFIPIDMLETLLNDELLIAKFKDFDKNSDLFGSSITKLEYISALKEYIENCKNYGKILTKKQLTNFKKLSGIKVFVDIKENKKLSNENDWVINVLNSNKDTKSLINQILREKKDNSPTLFYLKSVIERIMQNSQMLGIDLEVNNMQEKINLIQTLIKSKLSSYKLDHFTNLNSQLVTEITQNINPNFSNMHLARAIYIELNKKIKYNEIMIFHGSNTELDSVKTIHNQDISTISLDNNELTCKTASEIYSAILDTFNIDNFIVKKGMHHNVYVYDNQNIVIADATNIIKSSNTSEKFNDITRAKLGRPPAGFNHILGDIDYSDIDEKHVNTKDNNTTKHKVNLKLLEGFNDYNFAKNKSYSQLKDELITLINQQLSSIDDINGIEKMQYFVTMTTIISPSFSNIINGTTSFAYRNIDGVPSSTFIFSISDKVGEINEKEYLVIDPLDGLCVSTEESLEEKFNNQTYLLGTKALSTGFEYIRSLGFKSEASKLEHDIR